MTSPSLPHRPCPRRSVACPAKPARPAPSDKEAAYFELQGGAAEAAAGSFADAASRAQVEPPMRPRRDDDVLVLYMRLHYARSHCCGIEPVFTSEDSTTVRWSLRCMSSIASRSLRIFSPPFAPQVACALTDRPALASSCVLTLACSRPQPVECHKCQNRDAVDSEGPSRLCPGRQSRQEARYHRRTDRQPEGR